MALSIKYQKVWDTPVAPDAIQTGTTSLASYPAITGEFIINMNLNLKTYTFDLRGINEDKANEIIGYCNANSESMAKGEIDMTQLTGEGVFLYRNIKCLPLSYQDSGTLEIANTTKNYSSFSVTCITDETVTSI